jgi:Nucleoside transporter
VGWVWGVGENGGANLAVRSVDYFVALYTDPKPFLDSISLYYSLPQLPLTVLMLWRGERVSAKLRLWVAAGTFMSALVLLAVIGPLGPGYADVAIALMGSAMAIYQPTLFGIAARFPAAYNAAASTGQGLADIIASLVRISTKAILPDGADKRSADVFFGIGIFVLLLAIASMAYLSRSPFARQYLDDGTSVSADHDSSLNSSLSLAPLRPSQKQGLLAGGDGDELDWEGLGEEHGQRRRGSEAETDDGCSGFRRIPAVVRGAYLPLLCILLNFFTTFSVYPGSVDEIPYHNTFGDNGVLGHNDWWTIILLLTYAVFDTLGRSVSTYVRTSLLVTAILTLLRFLLLAPLIPALVFVAPNHTDAFHNDVVAVLVIALFALSNGVLFSRALILGPPLLHPDDQQHFGFMVSVVIQAGIMLGSLVSIGIGAVRSKYGNTSS